jgi:two-component system response regulator AlgR
MAVAEDLRTLIVDDEPLAVERLQIVCSKLEGISVIGTANDGDAALRLVAALHPDLVLLDITMPMVDGLSVAGKLGRLESPPAIVFVTAHDGFAVEAFDLDAVDYVLKPVAPDRLKRAIERVMSHGTPRNGSTPASDWLAEFWVPHKSELLRIAVDDVSRIDAERDYVRIHVGDQSYLLLQTITGLEKKLDPEQFIRIHRSTIMRRDAIKGLCHEGMGVWSVETEAGEMLRIGKTYLAEVKKMAGR